MDTLEFIDMKTTDEDLMAAILANAKSQCVWNGWKWDELSLREKCRYIPMAVELLKAPIMTQPKGIIPNSAWVDRDNVS